MTSSPDVTDTALTAVRAFYERYKSGAVRDAVDLMAPDFVGHVSAGMPVGAGTHVGREAMLRNCYGAIGHKYTIEPVPDEMLPLGDGRVVVIGTYHCTRRSDGQPFTARVIHIWTVADGLLIALEQLTDTALWPSPVAAD